MTQKTAKLLTTLKGWQGDARVYEVNPPMKWSEQDETNFVIVSAVDAMFSGPETFIFPATKEGDVFSVADFGELDGSYQGGLSHVEALANAGYEETS